VNDDVARPIVAGRNEQQTRTLADHTSKGDANGLESRRRKLEAGQGQDQGAWGKLTDDDLDVIDGKQDQLEGRLQQRYGYAKDQAKKEVNDWYGRQSW